VKDCSQDELGHQGRGHNPLPTWCVLLWNMVVLIRGDNESGRRPEKERSEKGPRGVAQEGRKPRKNHELLDWSRRQECRKGRGRIARKGTESGSSVLPKTEFPRRCEASSNGARADSRGIKEVPSKALERPNEEFSENDAGSSRDPLAFG